MRTLLCRYGSGLRFSHAGPDPARPRQNRGHGWPIPRASSPPARGQRGIQQRQTGGPGGISLFQRRDLGAVFLHLDDDHDQWAAVIGVTRLGDVLGAFAQPFTTGRDLPANRRKAPSRRTIKRQGSSLPWSGVRAAAVSSGISAASSGAGPVNVLAGRERRLSRNSIAAGFGVGMVSPSITRVLCQAPRRRIQPLFLRVATQAVCGEP